MSAPTEVGIVAAMELEVRPLISGWRWEDIITDGSTYRVYRSGNSALICSGPGYKNAWECTKVLAEGYVPRTLLSVGFAGALVSALAIADIFVPAHIVNMTTSARFSTGTGHGRLVTADRVAGKQSKPELAARFSAEAVDMEAAAVAEIAQARGCRFAAVKAISDGLDSEIDFVGKFVAADGFRTGAFVAHIAVRPWLWKTVRELRINSERASSNLCIAISSLLSSPEGIDAALASLSGGYVEQRI